MQSHQWNGHNIEVRLRGFARHLWMTVGFFVRVDGVLFKPPDELEGRPTRTSFTIGDREVKDGCVESTGKVFVLHTPYRLIIDGEAIAEGVVRSDNWYLTWGMLLAFLALILGIVLLIGTKVLTG
jgi:hypothetical protein